MIQGILLAAGRSTRFGDDKLRQLLADGRPMILSAVDALKNQTDEFLIVTNPENTALHKILDEQALPYEICYEARLGMGHSLATGVQATAEADGWVVGLADMPFIPPHIILTVVHSLREGSSLVAPFYQGKRGHPVGFGSKFKQALIQLTGDQGARDILKSQNSHLHRIECDESGILQDIDTPTALKAALGTSS
ncbi:MAG: nucleotidyltransferase family protein [Pseudomonadota bacterium]